MGCAVNVDTDVAVGIDGNDDCVGDGLVGDEVEVGNIGLAGGAGVDLEVSAFVADLGVDGGDVERNGSDSGGGDVAGASDFECEGCSATDTVTDFCGAGVADVGTGVGDSRRSHSSEHRRDVDTRTNCATRINNSEAAIVGVGNIARTWS